MLISQNVKSEIKKCLMNSANKKIKINLLKKFYNKQMNKKKKFNKYLFKLIKINI